MEKKLFRLVYRSLRQSGVRREKIHLKSKFFEDFDFEATDWLCFTFFLENQINKRLNDHEIQKMADVQQLVYHLNANRYLS